MSVVKVNIGTRSVDILQDTGCSDVIVKQQHVMENQYTGWIRLMQMVDIRRVPIVTVHIDFPYLSEQVQALCPQDAVYNVIVGNVPRARLAYDPNLQWMKEQAAVTRVVRRKQV